VSENLDSVARVYAGWERGDFTTVELKYFHLWTFRGGSVIRLESIIHEQEARQAAGLL
jgi:hypothetical protein